MAQIYVQPVDCLQKFLPSFLFLNAPLTIRWNESSWLQSKTAGKQPVTDTGTSGSREVAASTFRSATAGKQPVTETETTGSREAAPARLVV